MASPPIRQKTGQFAPGTPWNPNGRPKLPPELLSIKAMSQDEIARIVAKYWRMPVGELERLAKHGSKERADIPAGDLAVMAVLARAFTTGEVGGLAWLVERCTGRAYQADKPEDENAKGEDLTKLSTPELIKRARELLPAAEKETK